MLSHLDLDIDYESAQTLDQEAQAERQQVLIDEVLLSLIEWKGAETLLYLSDVREALIAAWEDEIHQLLREGEAPLPTGGQSW